MPPVAGAWYRLGMATAKNRPYRLGTDSAGITRGDGGRFMLEEPSKAVPVNPLVQEEEGKQPGEWAPGVGQCTDPMTGPTIPWPPADPANEKKPMKVGDR